MISKRLKTVGVAGKVGIFIIQITKELLKQIEDGVFVSTTFGGDAISMAASLATVLDLEDLCGYELAAAKKNSQTLAQVLQNTTPSNEDTVLPSAFDTTTDFEHMTDEEIEAAAKTEAESQVQTIALERVNAAGCIY